MRGMVTRGPAQLFRSSSGSILSPVIFVDVDDTLVRSFGSKRIPMSSTVEVVKKLAAEGVRFSDWRVVELHPNEVSSASVADILSKRPG